MIELSICIPTYNRAEYLKRCLDSIFGYGDNDIEIIVQDNDSPDATAEVVKSFSDPRLKYFRNERNIGGVHNIMSVITRAAGRYIYYLTDDAYLMPGAIDTIKEFIRKNEPSFFTSDIYEYFEKQKKYMNYSFFNKDIESTTTFDKNTIARIVLSARFLPRVCCKRSLVDFDFLNKHGDNWYPHVLMALQIYGKEKAFHYLAEQIVGVNIENESYGFANVDANDFSGMVSIIKIMSKHLDYEMLEALIFAYCRFRKIIFHELLALLSVESQANLRKEAVEQKFGEYHLEVS